MKKLVSVCILLSIAATTLGQAASKWAAKPVKADGRSAEWVHPFDYYDKETKLTFSITNDEDNLYLCFESSDIGTHLKIKKAGITVTLSGKGKERYQGAITYPVIDKKNPTQQNGEVPGQKIDLYKANAVFVLTNKNIKASGFATKNGLLSMGDTTGLHTGIRWDSTNKMVYEIAIPFTELFGVGYNPALLNNDINLSVEVSGMEQPNFSPGGKASDDMGTTQGVNQNYGGPAQQPNGMGNGSMAGPGGGMMGQPNTTMNRPDYPPPMQRDALYEKASFKEKFKPAKKK